MFAVWNVEIALRLVEPVGTSMAMGFLMLHSLPLVGLPFLIMAGLTLVRGSFHDRVWLLSWAGCILLSKVPPLLLQEESASAPISLSIGAIAGALLAGTWLISALRRAR
jgi:hypothetical protein